MRAFWCIVQAYSSVDSIIKFLMMITKQKDHASLGSPVLVPFLLNCSTQKVQCSYANPFMVSTITMSVLHRGQASSMRENSNSAVQYLYYSSTKHDIHKYPMLLSKDSRNHYQCLVGSYVWVDRGCCMACLQNIPDLVMLSVPWVGR